MTKGITQAQVDTAADALVIAGERPTVDRIRAFLGTGSPNTVTRMLETWWQALGDRLTTQQARVALPDVPEPVAVLATQLWDAALHAAQAEASQTLSVQAEAITARATQLDADRMAMSSRAEALELAAHTADQTRLLAEARLAEAQQLVLHQTAQIEDLTHERSAARSRIEELERARVELSERLARQVDAASAEREALAQHGRSVEDRAHQEVDRVRQDVKALQAQLSAHAKEHHQREQQLSESRDAALRDAARQQQEATAQRARADTLEEQLSRVNSAAAQRAIRSRSVKSARKQPAKTKAPK